jgi:hypothetical protein
MHVKQESDGNYAIKNLWSNSMGLRVSTAVNICCLLVYYVVCSNKYLLTLRRYFIFISSTKRAGVIATDQTRLREVLSSNLGLDIGHPE